MWYFFKNSVFGKLSAVISRLSNKNSTFGIIGYIKRKYLFLKVINYQIDKYNAFDRRAEIVLGCGISNYKLNSLEPLNLYQ